MTAPRKQHVGRNPGRPRSATSRSAILKAAYQLLRERGVSGFTVEGVAARAGAGKATIYRWWNHKGTLAIEAFLVAVVPQLDAARISDSAIADLRHQVHATASIYRGRVGQLLRELVALGQADPETSRRLRSDFVAPRRAAAMVTLRRAQEQGEIPASADPDVLVDALWGPIFHRLLVSHMKIDRRFIDSLLDLVLAGAMRKSGRRQGSGL
jgi:AcrR family transcriptional regulator